MVGAEYIMGMLPRGTHDYTRFIKPSELSRMARNVGLETVTLTGMSYNPLTKVYALGADSDVNYMIACHKPPEPPMTHHAPRAVLFDLDGTLADTAPDLGAALNRLLAAEGMAPQPYSAIRPIASHGARG